MSTTPNELTANFLRTIANNDNDDGLYEEFSANVDDFIQRDSSFDLDEDVYNNLVRWYNQSGGFLLTEKNQLHFVSSFEKSIRMVTNIQFQTVPYVKEFEMFKRIDVKTPDELLWFPKHEEIENESIKYRKLAMSAIKNILEFKSGYPPLSPMANATNPFDIYTNYLVFSVKAHTAGTPKIWLTKAELNANVVKFENLDLKSDHHHIIQAFFSMRQGCDTHVDKLINKLNGQKEIPRDLMIELANWHNRYAIFALHEKVYQNWITFYIPIHTRTITQKKYIYNENQEKDEMEVEDDEV